MIYKTYTDEYIHKEGRTNYFCRICQATLGKSAVIGHKKTPKHIKRVEAREQPTKTNEEIQKDYLEWYSKTK